MRYENLILLCILAAIVWLIVSVTALFRQHDRDLRSEVEQVNRNIKELRFKGD